MRPSLVVACCLSSTEPFIWNNNPDSKVHGGNMGPILGWQDPGGPHVGPMNFAIWEWLNVHRTLGNKSMCNFNQNKTIYLADNDFENVICKMVIILPWLQCIKYYRLLIYIMVIYNTIIHTEQQLQWYNLSHTLQSRMTPLISPSNVSYWVAFRKSSKKYKCDVSRTHFIVYYYTPAQRSWRWGILDSPCPSVCPSVRPSVHPSVCL